MIHLIGQQLPDGVSWGMLVRNFGVPGTMLLVFIWSLVKGLIITKREADERTAAAIERDRIYRESCVHECALLREYITTIKTESTQRIQNLIVEKDMWRDTAMRGVKLAVVATEKAEGA
jgi:hypothetical protein